MRLHRTSAAVIVLHCLLVLSASGQYDVERVMEKSFEQTEFFFTPYRFLPFGIGPFRNSVSGMLDDPFLELDVNPARLFRDTSGTGYFLADFRNSREITDMRNDYYPHAYLRTAVMDAAFRMPYPMYYVNTRTSLEPAVSLGYVFRFQSPSLNDISLGATYQLLTQDEDYYAVPQDIYTKVLGADYAGARNAGTENIPITDRYSGSNEMHQEGHLLSVFGGVDLTSQLQLGVKVGRVVFDREGSHGSSNVWETGSVSSSSLWKNMESREQAYRHWEGTVGLRYALGDATWIGATAARVQATADQSLPRSDSSFYSYGPALSVTENWGIHSSAGVQEQSWKHEGGTTILGAELSTQVNTDKRFQLRYQYSRQEVDIDLSGNIRDGSTGRSRWSWDTTVYQYESNYGVTDVRSGSGTTSGTSHELNGSYQWKLGDRVTLSLGGRVEIHDRETRTSESVIANRYSRYVTTGSYPYSSFDSTAETKQLLWTFTTSVSRLTIPIFVSYRVSPTAELLFGLNRSASNWKAEDVTLAIFDQRYHADQSGSTTKTNFGERYTQPRERTSEVRTAFMAGLTVTPTPSLSIRFLGVPNFIDTYYGSELSDVQLWLSVSIRP